MTYHNDMQDVQYRQFTTYRPFGVEMEVGNEISQKDIAWVIANNSSRDVLVTGWSQRRRTKSWHVKTDGTCAVKNGEDGFEITSYKAQGVYDMLHIADIASKISALGVQVNNKCGLHIHVDVKDFTPTQIGMLIGYWLKIEQVMMQTMPLARANSLYCRSLRGTRDIDYFKQYTPLEIAKIFKPKKYGFWDNPDRRVTMNLVNHFRTIHRKFFYRNTIEFRFPEGTLCSITIKNWIRLLVHFVEYVKKCTGKSLKLTTVDTVAEAMQYLGLGHDEEIFYVYSEGLHETRKWFLNQIVLKGWNFQWKQEARKILANIS